MFAQGVFYSMLLNCEWFLSGWGILVQFAGYRTTLTFLRKYVSLGCVVQLSTKRIICLFCAPICASKEWRNKQKISVIIHAIPLVWYLVSNFLMFLKHLGYGDFPITIGTCLSVPSLLTHSSTVSVSLECFLPWQDSPLYAKVLSGSTLKNSPVSSAMHTSRGS